MKRDIVAIGELLIEPDTAARVVIDRHVADHRDGAATVGLDHRAGLVHALGVSSTHRHRRTALGETPGDLAPDAAGRPGHQRPLTLILWRELSWQYHYLHSWIFRRV